MSLIAPRQTQADLALSRVGPQPEEAWGDDDLDQVLPPHSAETLSRALSVVPIYAHQASLLAPARKDSTALGRAACVAADVAHALRASLAGAADAGARLRQLARALAAGAAASVQAHADALLALVQGVQDAIDAALLRTRKVSRELEDEMRRVVSGAALARRWGTALRLASIGISVPSFATAVVAAVYNDTHPAVSLVMALVSASSGICAAVGPCVAQSFWEHREAEGAQPAIMQSVHVEMFRMQYPLARVLHWWTQLESVLRRLGTVAHQPELAIRLAEPVVKCVEQYAKHMSSILSSAISIESAFELQRREGSMP